MKHCLILIIVCLSLKAHAAELYVNARLTGMPLRDARSGIQSPSRVVYERSTPDLSQLSGVLKEGRKTELKATYPAAYFWHEPNDRKPIGSRFEQAGAVLTITAARFSAPKFKNIVSFNGKCSIKRPFFANWSDTSASPQVVATNFATRDVFFYGVAPLGKPVVISFRPGPEDISARSMARIKAEGDVLILTFSEPGRSGTQASTGHKPKVAP